MNLDLAFLLQHVELRAPFCQWTMLHKLLSSFSLFVLPNSVVLAIISSGSYTCQGCNVDLNLFGHTDLRAI